MTNYTLSQYHKDLIAFLNLHPDAVSKEKYRVYFNFVVSALKKFYAINTMHAAEFILYLRDNVRFLEVAMFHDYEFTFESGDATGACVTVTFPNKGTYVDVLQDFISMAIRQRFAKTTAELLMLDYEGEIVGKKTKKAKEYKGKFWEMQVFERMMFKYGLQDSAIPAYVAQVAVKNKDTLCDEGDDSLPYVNITHTRKEITVKLCKKPLKNCLLRWKGAVMGTDMYQFDFRLLRKLVKVGEQTDLLYIEIDDTCMHDINPERG